MCFTCGSMQVSLGGGLIVTCRRGYDGYTQPTDFNLGPEAVADFKAARWCYVSLTAEVQDAAGEVVGAACLYGVPESESAPCALEDMDSVQWVVGRACERARSFFDTPVA